MLYRLTVSMGLVGCKQTAEIDVDDADIAGMTEDEADGFVMREYVPSYLDNIIDYYVEREERRGEEPR